MTAPLTCTALRVFLFPVLRFSERVRLDYALMSTCNSMQTKLSSNQALIRIDTPFSHIT